MIPRVYLDNVIVSGLIMGDLSPIEEMNAAREIKALDAEGRLKLRPGRRRFHS